MMGCPDSCPHCGASLLSDPIPGNTAGARYRRGVGVEIQGVYDGVLFSVCPFCYGTWSRWDKDRNPRLWEAAERHRERFTRSMREADE